MADMKALKLKEVTISGRTFDTVSESEAGDELVTPIRRFLSAEITGDGTAQSTAHGLGAVPSAVVPMLTGGPAGYVQPVITEGTHTSTNVVVTVTTGWKYRVLALL